MALKQTVLRSALIFALSMTAAGAYDRQPCDRGAGGISHCEGTPFVCNNGSISGSRKICISADSPISRNEAPTRSTPSTRDANSYDTRVNTFPQAKAAHNGFANCPQMFPGVPPRIVRPGLRELCYARFAILHSAETRTPVFAVERLNRQILAQASDEPRTNVFFAEARLPGNERAELEDYADSGFDRGHMAPAGDQPDETSMAQSFSLANMVPQAPSMNRHPWKSIETATRKCVMRATGDVFVFTGPVYVEPVRRIGRNRVAVPTYLFKLVYDPSTHRAWAHWMENLDSARAGKPISYEELSRRIGVELLVGAGI